MTIKELRQITGLSQRAFGEKYHIPTRTVENWESGSRKPNETIMYLLERAVREDYMNWKEYKDFLISGILEFAGERFTEAELVRKDIRTLEKIYDNC